MHLQAKGHIKLLEAEGKACEVPSLAPLDGVQPHQHLDFGSLAF